MTAVASQKNNWAKFAAKVGGAALATTLSASIVAGTVAPAAANDFYYDEQVQNEFDDQQVYPAQSSRTIYRDQVGRFYIRNGRKAYIQYFQNSTHDPLIEPRRPRDRDHDRDRDRDHRSNRDKNLETAIIAGVAGLAIGAIIAGSSQEPRQVISQPKPRRVLPRNAFPDAPTSYEPRVITYEGAFEPWTQSWADWCENRYRSFNISNGTYTGYDGVTRFCVVK